MEHNNKKKKENINPDFSEILKGLDSKWVILSEDNSCVIAYSDDLDKIADKLGEGVLIKVPDSSTYLAPSTRAL
jgi:hypothetical protein